MNKEYLIYKSGVDKEDLFLYDSTLVDIFENSIMLKISKLIVLDYCRRAERYNIAVNNYIISISPKIDLLANMKDDEERLSFVESNWKNIVRLTLSQVHPNSLSIKQISTVNTDYSYYKLVNLIGDNSFTTMDYFINNYPELHYIQVYNGYKHSELTEYVLITPKQ